MNILFSNKAWGDYLYWKKNDKKKLKKINDLLRSIKREGILNGEGKPELLKFSFSGLYSRRIDQEHRLIYRIKGEVLEIASCRFHYN